MTFMKKFFIFICLCAYLPVCAQTVLFKVQSDSVVRSDFQLMVKAMGSSTMSHTPLALSDNGFQGEVEKASDGFYVLYGMTSRSQMHLPLYLPECSSGLVLPLTLKGACPQVNLDDNNKALSAFNEVVYTQSRHLWMEGKKMNQEQLLPFLKGYQEKADSIAALYRCADAVKEYLKLWAACQSYSDYEALPMSAGIRKSDLPFKVTDVVGAAQEICNHPMASYFYQTVSMALQSLPDGALKVKMGYLYSHFTNRKIRTEVVEALVSNYLRTFNYADDFENGLQELTAVVEEYELSDRHVKDFKARRSTVKGTDFPRDVHLVDAEGNVMDFSSLKGSYVYIDLWASWCVPCQKEIPHLQKLEQEMNGKNIKFLSVSIDRKAADWKKKLQQLDLHGLQWHDEGGKLANALNVKGIPFFLIYDKEGKLYRYNAPRPSSGEKLKALLDGLD